MLEPAYSHMFVHADGTLAEYLCHVEVLGLTTERAEQLRHFHLDHTAADCLVLAAIDRLISDGRPVAPTS